MNAFRSVLEFCFDGSGVGWLELLEVDPVVDELGFEDSHVEVSENQRVVDVDCETTGTGF